MKKSILMLMVTSTFLISVNSLAAITQPGKLEGTVVSFDAKSVELKAYNGQKFSIPRSAVPREKKLSTGTILRLAVEIDISKIEFE